MKVISQDIVYGNFAVTVDTYHHKKKNNDILTDNYGRKFIIESIAMTNSHTETLFILTPLDGEFCIGDVVI